MIRYAGDVDPAALAATTKASQVTASAGPWPVAQGILGRPADGRVMPAQLSGRPTPDATIDNATIEAGRWWQAPGEAVLDEQTARVLGKQVGDTVTVHASSIGNGTDPFGPSAGPGRDLVVVGIAGSVSTPGVQAWIAPGDIAAIAPDGPTDQEVLYRVAPSATAADLTAATAAITAGLPADAVLGTDTYLELKAGVDRIADLYVPVLLAFSVFAMLAAAFLIANIVTGVVLTSYRDIGIMKAVGYTPGQVTTILARPGARARSRRVGRRGRPRDDRQPAVDPRHGPGLRAAVGVQPLRAGRRDRARRRPGDLPARGDRPRSSGRSDQRGRGDDPRRRPDPPGRRGPLAAARSRPADRTPRPARGIGRSRAAGASVDDAGALVVGVAAATFTARA